MKYAYTNNKKSILNGTQHIYRVLSLTIIIALNKIP